MRKVYWLLAAPIAAVAIQAFWYAPRLPERVASHFDAAGVPNGWSSRGELLATFGGMFALTSLGLLGLIAVLPRIPRPLVSLPRREHWLAPERRAATIADLRRRLAWFAFATQVFLAGTVQLAIEANLAPDPRLPSGPLYALLGGYLAFTLGWIVVFYRRFAKRPAAPAPEGPEV